MTKTEFAGMIDHTLLKPAVSYRELENLCRAAVTYGFATVAVQPTVIPFIRNWLDNYEPDSGFQESAIQKDSLQRSRPGITAALSYPQGNWSAAMKCREIELAIADGATDCDMVINIGALREGRYTLLKQEARECRKASSGYTAKAILEVCLLNEEQIRAAGEIYADAGFDYLKSSTGFLKPPTLRQISLMTKAAAGSVTKVKAAGGIAAIEIALALIQAGVSRLGTSSGERLIQEYQEFQ
jgi:deoxyribose-phosphate aldolase